ncbi:MAG: hypothetical protein ACLFVU_13875 [Phycisphaerae bacterium]
MLEKHVIFGVHIDNRLEEAVEVQKLLTQYGSYIKTRLGLHEVEGGTSAANGLLLLEMVGADGQNRELMDKLNAIIGVEVKSIEFNHPDRPE